MKLKIALLSFAIASCVSAYAKDVINIKSNETRSVKQLHSWKELHEILNKIDPQLTKVLTDALLYDKKDELEEFITKNPAHAQSVIDGLIQYRPGIVVKAAKILQNNFNNPNQLAKNLDSFNDDIVANFARNLKFKYNDEQTLMQVLKAFAQEKDSTLGIDKIIKNDSQRACNIVLSLFNVLNLFNIPRSVMQDSDILPNTTQAPSAPAMGW